MSKKLQSFYIYKFDTSRLKNSNYKIQINLREARRNNEVISMADNAMFRALRKIKNNYFDDQKLIELQIKKKEIKKLYNSKENKKNLLELERQVDELLFISEIISVKVLDNRHYKKIINNGLQINGINFKRLLCGSGQARRNTVIMISEEYFYGVMNILDNGRDKNGQIVGAKYNSYLGLSSSGGWQVSIPKIIVVKDCIVKRNVDVEYISEVNNLDTIEPRNMELEFNLFDGQGLISETWAEHWANDLELDYIPSSFVVRSAFLKGQVITFPFHRFAREISHKNFVVDIWGEERNILDADIIVSESQLKLWSFYNGMEDYLENCSKNDFGWSISRYAKKSDATFVKTNYQFLQILNLDDNQIKNLCQPTIDFFNKSILTDYKFSLLYLLGNYIQEEIDNKWISNIGDNVTQALIYNSNLLHDPYIQGKIIKSLNKKIRQSYIGNLFVEGQYSPMVSDPYAMCEHIFDMEVKGLLNKNEYFSNFWNKRNVDKIVLMRAPLTWKSESVVANLKINNKLEDWLSYSTSGVIYNVFGVDDMLMADADRDGDLCFSSNQRELIDGSEGGLPITFDKLVANKSIVNHNELYKFDLLAFNSKVGFVTNVSTTLYSFLPLYDKNSLEYKEIIRRLKVARLLQSREIDGAKGILKKPMEKSWTRWQKKKPEMSTEEKEKIDFENKLIADRRPYFMRFLYGNYNRKYKKFLQTFESITQCRLGISLEDLLSKPEYDLNDEERKIIDGYHKFNPLLDTNSIMNAVCHYMESQVKELKLNMKNVQFNPEILMNKDIPIDPNKLGQMKKLWGEWKVVKRNHGREEDGEESEGIQHIAKEFHLRMEKISSNGNELVNLCVQLLYKDNPKSPKDFLWSILGDELLEIIKQNSKRPYSVPVKDENGSIDYMGQKYEMREIYV